MLSIVSGKLKNLKILNREYVVSLFSNTKSKTTFTDRIIRFACLKVYFFVKIVVQINKKVLYSCPYTDIFSGDAVHMQNLFLKLIPIYTNCVTAEILHTDYYLLDQVSGGDTTAFEAIYLRYWRPLLNAAYKRLKDKQQAEDIVQNVFLRLWNKREHLNILSLSAYLHGAVRYEVLKFISRSKGTLFFHSLLEEVIMDAESADAKILSSEMMELVLAYAQTLPQKRRNIFLLHLQDNLSTKQIADTLQVTQKTVQNQLRTALNGLQAEGIPTILVILAYILNL